MQLLLIILYIVLVLNCIVVFRLSMGPEMWATKRMKAVAILLAVVPIVNTIALFFALGGLNYQLDTVIRIIGKRLAEDSPNPFHEVSKPEARVYEKILEQIS